MSRLVALQLSPRRSLFEFLGDHVTIVGPGQAGSEAPDLLVFPFLKGGMDLYGPEFRLAPELVARVVGGQTAIVFDFSTEGVPHTPERSDWLHGYLQREGAPLDRCVYISQDRSYEAAYQAYCRARGWVPMRVLTYDYFIRLIFNVAPGPGYKMFKARRRAFMARSAERERRFICLNFTPRTAKVMFLLALLERGLWDEGFVSFGGFAVKGERGRRVQKMRRALLEFPGFEDIAPSLVGQLERLDSFDQVVFGHVKLSAGDAGRAKAPLLDNGLDEHSRSWFTVVTETEISGPRRVTEKPFKPLMNFHPVIVLGNPGALELIRSFGFSTFPDYFDESYDAEADPRRRFEMVLAEVERLCALDEGRLREMEARLKKTLMQNALWGLTELPSVYRERIDPALLAEVVAVLKGEAADRPSARLDVVVG